MYIKIVNGARRNILIIKYILFTILVIIIALLIIAVIRGNTAIEINTITVSSKSLPVEFDRFKIAQISDLHNAEFGKNNTKLISLLEKAKADIIVITGDIIDSRRTNIDKAVYFAERAVKIAPTYYVNGNHESRLSNTKYNHLIKSLEQAGVTVLENDISDISVGDKIITLIGINDPGFRKELVDDNVKQNIAQQIMSSISEKDNYKVLLAHRPEYFDVYADKVDLVLAGHAHGGQFIIPFVGGLVAPGQGLLPKYYDGIYKHNTTYMIVSRGIGNSIFPFRINNRPVIVLAELQALSDE